MASATAVIVDANKESPKIFSFDTNEITFGRNPANSIDIPERIISRQQCAIKYEENHWRIYDTSSLKTTVLNECQLDGSSSVVESGDKISFLYCKTTFLFYHSHEELPSIYRKRKRNESDSGEKKDYECVAKGKEEVEKYKLLYLQAQEDLEKVKIANAVVADELRSDLAEQKELVEDLGKRLEHSSESEARRREDLLVKLGHAENTNENMILEMQRLTEMLKDCEEEKQRLLQESHQIPECAPASRSELPPSTSDRSEDGSLSPSTLLNLVDLVEVKWNEQEVKRVKGELSQKLDELTDLRLQTEKHQQDLMETVDKELLCSICSEILCNVITLNCMHSFCKSCLMEWKTKKKECPVCRTKIKTEVHPLVMDSFIDRLCDFMGGEMKSHREEVKAERAKGPYTSNPDGEGNKWRGNRRGRQTTPRRRRGFVPMPGIFTHPNHPNLIIDLNQPFNFPVGIIDLTDSSPARPRRNTRINNNNI